MDKKSYYLGVQHGRLAWLGQVCLLLHLWEKGTFDSTKAVNELVRWVDKAIMDLRDQGALGTPAAVLDEQGMEAAIQLVASRFNKKQGTRRARVCAKSFLERFQRLRSKGGHKS